jgi:multidrug resistance efflux pump
MSYKLIIAVVLVLGAIGVAVGFAWPRWQSPEVLELAGIVEIQEVRLASKVGGRIEKVLVSESELVSANQPLIVLDSRELVAQQDQLRAKLDSAKSALEKAENGPLPEEKTAAKAAIEAAEAKLERLENGARQESIDATRAELAAEEAEMQAKDKDLARVTALHKRGAKSDSDLDDARRDFNVAKARADAARARFNLITAPPRTEDVAEVKAEIARLTAQWQLLENGTREEDKAMARAQVADLEAQLAALQVQLDETVIKAAEPCRIEVLVLREGDMASPGQTVVRVLRADDRWVKAYVPEVQLGGVRLKQKVEIRTDARRDKPLSGTVVHIAEISEFTPRNVQTLEGRKHQVFAVKIRVDDPEGILKSGMAAQVTLPLKQ